MAEASEEVYAQSLVTACESAPRKSASVAKGVLQRTNELKLLLNGLVNMWSILQYVRMSSIVHIPLNVLKLVLQVWAGVIGSDVLG